MDSKPVLTVAEFAEAYGLGRTSVYAEIKKGVLRARKAGARTLISSEDAEAWFRALPELNTAKAA
jgi:excisionase family DNA binding protein